MDNKNEIDLFELLIKIYLYLKKYYLVIIIAVLSAVVFTFAKNYSSPEKYTSSMILSVKPDNNYMYAITLKEYAKRYEKNPAEIITGIISQANEMLKNGNTEILAKKMNIDTKDLKHLKSISSIYKFDKNEAPGSIVKVNATASNKIIFNNLGNGIINLINNNSYVKSKTSEDSLMIINIIKTTDKKIKELDSLQEKFLKDGKINDLIIFKDNSFFGESIMMTSLKEKLKNELQNIKQAKLVENFYTPGAVKTSIKTALIINTAVSLFFAVFIIAVIVFIKKAKDYEKNRNNS